MNSYENPQMSYECDLTAQRDKLRADREKLISALLSAAGALELVYAYGAAEHARAVLRTIGELE